MDTFMRESSCAGYVKNISTTYLLITIIFYNFLRDEKSIYFGVALNILMGWSIVIKAFGTSKITTSIMGPAFNASTLLL